MIKKWSYVAAAMLTVASGLALTSCIDNDEPFGIREIRQATANLLEAKKAAVEAEAAAKSAQVEIAKINAEIEKLRIENEKILAEANARIAEAEANKIEAEAQAELLRAQGEKAVSDAEAAKLGAEAAAKEKEADYWQAQADAIRLDAQGRYEQIKQDIAERQQAADNAQKWADQTLAQAIYAFEKEKAYNANSWNQGLWGLVETAFSNYLESIRLYNEANKTLSDDLNKLKEIEADLVWIKGKGTYGQDDYVPGHFESPKRDKKVALENAIAQQKRDIDKYTKVIEAYKEFTEKVDAFGSQAAPKLLEEYTALLDQYKKAEEQAALEFEQLKIDNGDIYLDVTNCEADYAEVKNMDIPIDPYTIEPIDVLGAVNKNWQKPHVVVAPNTNYTLVDIEADPTDNAYESAKVAYNKWIKRFNLAMLDDNDIEWSKARLNEMNRQRENNKTLEDAVEFWKAAKEAYNMGNEPIGTALPYGAELQEAVDNYNDFGTTITEANNKVTDADDKESAAEVAYENAMKEYQGSTDKESVPGKLYQALLAKDKAKNDARLVQMAAIDKAEAAYQNALEAIELKASNLYLAWQKAIVAQAELPDNATEAEISGAEDNVKAARKAYYEYMYPYRQEDENGNYVLDEYGNYIWEQSGRNVDRDNAWSTRQAAMLAANTAYNKAVNAADEAYNKAWDAYLQAGGSNLAEKDEAYKPVAKALSEYQNARLEAEKARTELNKLVQGELYTLWRKVENLGDKQLEGINKLYNASFNWPYEGNMPDSDNFTYYVRDDFFNSDGSFKTVVAPIMLLNGDAIVKNDDWEDQVYANARALIEYTSEEAYGVLGSDFDNLNPSYDWEQDKAFLLDEVTVDVINEYIEKKIYKRTGKSKEDITPFEYENLYENFGEFGKQAKLLVNISYAEACVDPDANNNITAEIDHLQKNLDAIEEKYDEMTEALAEKDDLLQEARSKRDDLEAQAKAAIADAHEFWKVYNKIVNEGTSVTIIDNNGTEVTVTVEGLQKQVDDLKAAQFVAWVDYVEDGVPHKREVKGDEAIQYIKEAYENEIKSEADLLAKAQEALDYFEYQLGQYEAGYDVEDPQVYVVKLQQAEVERLEKLMNYWKDRYNELLDQYNAAKKEANFPD